MLGDVRVDWLGPRVSQLLGTESALFEELLRSDAAVASIKDFLNGGEHEAFHTGY